MLKPGYTLIFWDNYVSKDIYIYRNVNLMCNRKSNIGPLVPDPSSLGMIITCV